MYQYYRVSLIHNCIKIGYRGITNGSSIQKSETTMMENFNNFRKTLYKTRVEEANLLRLTRKQKSLTNGINTVSSSPSSSFIFHILDGNRNKNNDLPSKSSLIIRQRKNAAVIVPLTDDFNIVHKDKDDENQSDNGSDDDNDSLNSASSLSNNIQQKPSYNRMTNYMVNPTTSSTYPSSSSSSSSPKAKGMNRYHITSFDDSYDEGNNINTATTATTLTSSTAANRSSFSLKIVEEDDDEDIDDDDCDESNDHVNNDSTTLNLNTVHPSTTITHHDDNNDNDVTTNDNNNNDNNNSSRRESNHQTTVSRLLSTPSTRTKDGSFLSNITEIRLNIQVDYYYYYCCTIICYTMLYYCYTYS
jgi:hypothetical protein